MSYKAGTATGFRDYVRQIRNFVCGYGEDNPETFSGSQDTARVWWFGAKPSGPPPGNGPAVGNWQLVCTTGGTIGVAVFDVINPAVSTIGTATAGTYFDHAEVSLMIYIESYQSFNPGDTFTIAVTGDSATYTDDVYWTLNYEEFNGTILGQNYFQLEGRGLSNDKTINIIMETRGNVPTTRWHIGYAMAMGYTPGAPTWSVESQPGVFNAFTYNPSNGKAAPNSPSIDMPFHIFVNKQRFIVMNETAAGLWHGSYCGFFFPYGSPQQYPFPCYVGSNIDNYTTSSTAIGDSISSFVDPAYECGRLKTPGGANEDLHHRDSSNNRSYSYNQFWPYNIDTSRSAWQALTISEDLTYPMFPVVIRETSPSQNLGELDGVCALPGLSLNPGDTITDSNADDWIVFRHPFYTAAEHFFAVRKD